MELKEHLDSVTSISVYNPKGTSVPLLVTASIDKSIIIWSIDTNDVSKTAKVKKLIGHSDRVCSIDVFTPTDSDNRLPLLISGSDDKSLMGKL